MTYYGWLLGMLLAGLAGCQSEEAVPRTLQKILVIGNSITYHPPDPTIGWNADWGMAASAPDKDYFSQLRDSLQSHLPGLQLIRENVYPFERQFASLDYSQYQHLRDFKADLLIIRLGENVSPEALQEWNFSEELQNFAGYLTSGDGRVIISSTFWPNPRVNEQLHHAASHGKWEFVELSDLGQVAGFMALKDFKNESVASHPNNLGMEIIARRLISQILKK